MTDFNQEAANRATDKALAEREVELLKKELMDHVLEEMTRASLSVEMELRALHESLLQIAPSVLRSRFRTTKLQIANQPVPGIWGLPTESVHEIFFRTHRQLLLNQAKTVEILKLTTQVANDLTTADFDTAILTMAQHEPSVAAKQLEIEARLKAASENLNTLSRPKGSR